MGEETVAVATRDFEVEVGGEGTSVVHFEAGGKVGRNGEAGGVGTAGEKEVVDPDGDGAEVGGVE